MLKWLGLVIAFWGEHAARMLGQDVHALQEVLHNVKAQAQLFNAVRDDLMSSCVAQGAQIVQDLRAIWRKDLSGHETINLARQVAPDCFLLFSDRLDDRPDRDTAQNRVIGVQ